MIELLEELTEDEEIKGIILRINSGGGGARASALIWNAVRKAQQKKPVVVSMTGAAASGGYMISASAGSIVAYPLTITGSIGVFGGKFSMKGLFELIGLNIEIIKRGKNATMFTDAQTWTESEKERVRHSIQECYDDFVGKVAGGRGMSVNAVDDIAQGRVWTGQQALERGLVDKLGGMETAIAMVKEKIGIPADEDVLLVDYPKMENPVKLFLKRLRETHIDSKIPAELRQVQRQLEELNRLENEHLFAWFPYIVIE
jgi:protease-4